MISLMLTWTVLLIGFSLLLAWAKQLSSYVLGFSLTDRSAWRRVSIPIRRFAARLWAAEMWTNLGPRASSQTNLGNRGVKGAPASEWTNRPLRRVLSLQTLRLRESSFHEAT
jgi:hypothetical protein